MLKACSVMMMATSLLWHVESVGRASAQVFELFTYTTAMMNPQGVAHSVPASYCSLIFARELSDGQYTCLF